MLTFGCSKIGVPVSATRCLASLSLLSAPTKSCIESTAGAPHALFFDSAPQSPSSSTLCPNRTSSCPSLEPGSVHSELRCLPTYPALNRCGPHKLAEAFDFCLKDTMIMSSRATSPSVAPADGIGSPHQSLFEPTPEIPIAVPLTESQRPREDYFSSAMTEGEFSIRKAAIIAAAAEPPTSPLPRDKKPKLLLVEDNQINLHVCISLIHHDSRISLTKYAAPQHLHRPLQLRIRYG